jgi:hypothetical protein
VLSDGGSIVPASPRGPPVGVLYVGLPPQIGIVGVDAADCTVSDLPGRPKVGEPQMTYWSCV